MNQQQTARINESGNVLGEHNQVRVNGPLKGSILGELHHAVGCRYGFGEDTAALPYTGKTALPDAFSRGDKTAQRGNILQSHTQVGRPCVVVHVETRRKRKRPDEGRDLLKIHARMCTGTDVHSNEPLRNECRCITPRKLWVSPPISVASFDHIAFANTRFVPNMHSSHVKVRRYA